MSFKVFITKDFDHMSEVAAQIVVKDIKNTLHNKDAYVLGLATGNTPTGLYKHFAASANAKAFDCTKIQSFNLDEYVGLPGENAQQRAMHPESYSFFMVQELFGLLEKKFKETNVPWGTLIDQERLLYELNANPNDWEEQGTDKGKAIVIKTDAQSEYLAWIRKEILDAYWKKIEGNKMLLVKLDENTLANAVKDGHFSSKEQSPWYAISMGVELVYNAKTVLLLANGERKVDPVAESLLHDSTPLVPISYGQIFSKQGGTMIYVIDKAAAKKVLENPNKINQRGIEIENISD